MSCLGTLSKAPSAEEAAKLLKEIFLSPSAVLSENQKRLEISVASLLSDFYAKHGEIAQIKIGTAAKDILHQWASCPPSDKEAREELLYFMARTKPMEALRTLRMLINSRVAVKQGDIEFHSRLLAILLDYQELLDISQRCSVSFWKEQKKVLLEKEYAALIWSGVLQRDKDKAFKMLPHLATNRREALLLTRVFPWVIERFFQDNEEEFRDKLNDLSEVLSKPVMKEFDSFFTGRRLIPLLKRRSLLLQLYPEEATGSTAGIGICSVVSSSKSSVGSSITGGPPTSKALLSSEGPYGP